MRRFKLQKLVRDKVLDNILNGGNRGKYRRLHKKEFLKKLQEKLLEEAKELLVTKKNDRLEELADIQEIINQLLKVWGVTPKKFTNLVKSKNKKVGSFTKKIYIESVDLNENDPWVPYYAKRFPEIKVR